MVNEGGEAWVFPLRNVRSGLAQFLGKLYKFVFDSPEMKSLLDRVRTGAPPPSEFSVKARAREESTLHSMLHTEEIHEAGGGVFRFTRFLRNQPDSHPAYDAKRMKSAEALMHGGRYGEAVAVYDTILADHPQHSEALLDKGIALSAQNDEKHAIEPLEMALEIEPNDTSATAVLSHAQEAIGRPEFALRAVQNSLERWKWDYKLWTRELDIALAWDFVELAENRIKELRKFVPDATRLSSLDQRAKESRERRRAFTTELAKAIALQSRDHDYERAKAHCFAAAKASRRNTLARLNLAICCYHTGDYPHAAGETLEALERFVGMARPGATILALMSAVRSGRDCRRSSEQFSPRRQDDRYALRTSERGSSDRKSVV